MVEHPKILVVDDIPRNVRILRDRLVKEGYQVIEAGNGEEALEKVNRESPDLILLDIIMPNMDGYQVLEHLKADETTRHIPVIVISAVDQIESAAKCIELGAEEYLFKPFNSVILKARVRACLEKKKWHDQEKLYLHQIEEEKKRSDDLLHVILPNNIVEELKSTHKVKPRRHGEVSVLFCDIAGFTPYCDENDPEKVISNLDELTVVFEDLTLSYGLEKINSIGDQFMAACGLRGQIENPVLNCVKCALEMIDSAQRSTANWKVRIGIHVGSVVSGVLGRRKFLFALLGDTVNVAERMQSHGLVGSVNVSKTAWEKISGLCYGESRGLMPIKGKGKMEVFRVDGLSIPTA